MRPTQNLGSKRVSVTLSVRKLKRKDEHRATRPGCRVAGEPENSVDLVSEIRFGCETSEPETLQEKPVTEPISLLLAKTRRPPSTENEKQPGGRYRGRDRIPSDPRYGSEKQKCEHDIE